MGFCRGLRCSGMLRTRPCHAVPAGDCAGRLCTAGCWCCERVLLPRLCDCPAASLAAICMVRRVSRGAPAGVVVSVHATVTVCGSCLLYLLSVLRDVVHAGSIQVGMFDMCARLVGGLRYCVQPSQVASLTAADCHQSVSFGLFSVQSCPGCKNTWCCRGCMCSD